MVDSLSFVIPKVQLQRLNLFSSSFMQSERSWLFSRSDFLQQKKKELSLLIFYVLLLAMTVKINEILDLSGLRKVEDILLDLNSFRGEFLHRSIKYLEDVVSPLPVEI